MKKVNFAEILLRFIKAVIGLVLCICSVILVVPARIAVGVSEVLNDIGNSLMHSVVIEKDESKVVVIEEKKAK